MGGTLQVVSQEGLGSQFFFEIVLPIEQQKIGQQGAKKPLQNICDFPSNPEMPTLDLSHITCPENAPRILLVEDTLVNQQVIKIMLGNMGLPVEIAENGREASYCV